MGATPNIRTLAVNSLVTLLNRSRLQFPHFKRLKKSFKKSNTIIKYTYSIMLCIYWKLLCNSSAVWCTAVLDSVPCPWDEVKSACPVYSRRFMKQHIPDMWNTPMVSTPDKLCYELNQISRYREVVMLKCIFTSLAFIVPFVLTCFLWLRYVLQCSVVSLLLLFEFSL